MSDQGESTKVKVCVIGSCNYDITSFVDEFPDPGETVLSRDFATYAGGKGLNQAVKCAELFNKPGSVVFMGKVGQDEFGEKLVSFMKEKNINSGKNQNFVQIAPNNIATGSALILVTKDGENMIVVNQGANASVSVLDVQTVEFDLIRQSDVSLCQLELPISTVREVLCLARKHLVTTILNPSPIPKNLDYNIFNLVDILCLNLIEAQQITNYRIEFNDFDQLIEETAQKTFSEIFKLAQTLQSIIITCGARGAICAERNSVSLNSSFDFVPSEESITGLDTTGAGDAFVGALAYYVSSERNNNNFTLKEKVRLSNLAAMNSIRRGRQKL